LVDGLINDCARIIAEKKTTEDWFDLSTLKEPYRVEGKKTMGYEIAEQLDWHLPDVIIYPTGGGTGLIGMGPHPASVSGRYSEKPAGKLIGPLLCGKITTARVILRISPTTPLSVCNSH